MMGWLSNKLQFVVLQHGTRHVIDSMIVQGHQVNTIFACGGGSQNDVFIQVHADVTGMNSCCTHWFGDCQSNRPECSQFHLTKMGTQNPREGAIRIHLFHNSWEIQYSSYYSCTPVDNAQLCMITFCTIELCLGSTCVPAQFRNVCVANRVPRADNRLRSGSGSWIGVYPRRNLERSCLVTFVYLLWSSSGSVKL